jgi:hypothetical protein
VRELLRVRVTQERHGASLAHSLSELDGLDVRCNISACEVTVDSIESDRTVIAVLDAIRDTLAGDLTSSAVVLLDGREYQMQGE